MRGKEVYVCDCKNDRIQVFDAYESFVRQWGTKAEGEGQLRLPRRMSMSDGELFVSDENNRIQVFS